VRSARAHLLRQAQQCPTHGHPCGIGAGTPGGHRDLRVAVTQLQPRDHQLPLLRAQVRQRLAQALLAFRFAFRAQQHREWRRATRDVGAVHRNVQGAARVASELVLDAVADGLAQVGPQSVAPPWLEVAEVAQGPNDSLLDEIGRVRDVARPSLQTAVRPSAQGRQKPCEEGVQRLPVTATRAMQEPERTRRSPGPLRVRRRPGPLDGCAFDGPIDPRVAYPEVGRPVEPADSSSSTSTASTSGRARIRSMRSGFGSPVMMP